MYNEGRKREYLEYKGQDYLKNLFKDSQQYELSLGKDLCDMDTSELIHYLIRYDGYRTFEDKRRQLSNYAEWCVIKGYGAFNWISPKVVPNKSLKEIYLKAKEDLYISPETYDRYIDKLLKSNYGVYIASVFACIYEGISGKGFYNLAKLRIRDIDIEKNCIHLPDGTDRKVSQSLIQMLLDTSKVESVTNEKTVRYISSLYEDSIWKLRKNKDVTYSKMQRKFIFLIEEMKEVLEERKLSKTAIERSGYFNRIYYTVLKDGTDIRELEFGADKKGREDNKSYDKYFENTELNMNMRKFMNSFQSYLNQV